MLAKWGKTSFEMKFQIPKSRALLLLALGAPTALVFYAGWSHVAPLKDLQVFSRDLVAQVGRQALPDPDILFIGIDDISLEIHNEAPEDLAQSPVLQSMAKTRYPWNRGVHAALIERLAGAGAKAIIFDVVFDKPNPDDQEGDEELREAIERHQDKVVLGAKLDIPDPNLTQSHAMITIPDSFLPWDELPGDFGFVNFFPLDDSNIRSGTYRLSLSDLGGNTYETDEVYLSLVAAGLSKVGMEIPDTRDPIYFRFPRYPQSAYVPIRYYEVLWPSLWETNFGGGEVFRDKIIVVGALSQILQDTVETPKGLIPGPLAHVCFAAAVKNGEIYELASPRTSGIAILLAPLLACLIAYFIRQPVLQLIGLLAAIVAIFCGATWLYSSADFLLPPGVPIVSLFFTGLWIFGTDFAIERFQKRRVRRLLERCVSKDIVGTLLNQSEEMSLALGGAYKQGTILFTDLRSFTSTTEGMDPIELVTQLNEYLTEMVTAVFNNQGTLDKFIGDAVMAVWGTVRTNGPQADCINAVKAALEMQERLAALNARWESEGRVTFKFGAGINHGKIVCGHMGSKEKSEFTVIGDAVNVAARFESITKELGVSLAIGEQVAEYVDEEFGTVRLGEIPLKGKSQPLPIYTLKKLAPPPKEEVVEEAATT